MVTQIFRKQDNNNSDYIDQMKNHITEIQDNSITGKPNTMVIRSSARCKLFIIFYFSSQMIVLFLSFFLSKACLLSFDIYMHGSKRINLFNSSIPVWYHLNIMSLSSYSTENSWMETKLAIIHRQQNLVVFIVFIVFIYIVWPR